MCALNAMPVLSSDNDEYEGEQKKDEDDDEGKWLPRLQMCLQQCQWV